MHGCVEISNLGLIILHTVKSSKKKKKNNSVAVANCKRQYYNNYVTCRYNDLHTTNLNLDPY